MNSKPKYDITILTDSRYVNPKDEDINWYVQNILDEDNKSKLSCIAFNTIRGGKPFDINTQWFTKMLKDIGQK